MLKQLRRLTNIRDNYDFYAFEANHKKTFNARIIDSIFIYAVVIFPLFLWALSISGNIILPIVLSMALFCISLPLFYMYLKQEYNDLKVRAYNQIKRKELEDNLVDISPDSFQSLLIDLLLDSNMFITIVIGKNTIEGIAEDVRYAIGYDVTRPQETTTWKNIEEFMGFVQYPRHKDVLFFTNTYFDESCQLLKKSFKDYTIHLIDRDFIVKLLMDSNLVLKESELEEIVSKKYEYAKQIAKLKKYNTMATGKTRDLFLYSAIFLLLAFIGGEYSTYYTLISLLFSLLGVIYIILKKIQSRRSSDLLSIYKK